MLLLLGGTFDPPHYAHLLLASCALHQFNADRVLFLPAGDPYRKRAASHQPSASPLLQLQLQRGPEGEAQSEITPAAHRLAMTRLATAPNPRFTVDDREVRRPGPSYTVDTLRELHNEGHQEITLILGSDALADLPHWKEPEEITRLATLAIAQKPQSVSREPSDSPSPVYGRGGWGVRANPKSAIPNPQLIDMPPLPFSSTLIRARVRENLPIRYLTPDPVAAYIEEHRLYLSPAPAMEESGEGAGG